jgi:uncharacterized coiled-coil protein SlyX
MSENSLKDLEVTLYLDGNPDNRVVAHQEHEISTLKKRVKELEFECAELQTNAETILERMKKIAMQRPKGYNPNRRFDNKNNNGNGKKKFYPKKV